MPTFTAEGGMSSNTQSIWRVTKSGSTSSTSATPRVFCAVSAQMTLSP